MIDPPLKSSAANDWSCALERSKAQIEAGEIVPLGPVLERLRASSERLEDEMGLESDDPDVIPPP